MTSQSRFRAGLLDPAQPVPDGLCDGGGRPAGRRYDVYRNNVAVSLIEAMKTAFPLVLKLIGTQNFDRLAGIYVRDHPPSSPLMMFYGARFPDFLEGFAPLAHIGYLSDAARLDIALRQSYHAADAAPFDPEPLQKFSSEALLEATIRLAPSTRILRSCWPLHDIWVFNQSTDAEKPRSISQDILVTRVGFDPIPHALPVGGALWLETLASGVSFGEAHDIALAAHTDFDLATCLTLALSTQALAAINHKDHR